MKNIKDIKKKAALGLSLTLALGLLAGCGAGSISLGGGAAASAPAGSESAPLFGGSSVSVSASKLAETELDGIACLTVSSGGSYTLSGVYEDQMILVDAKGQNVELVLDGLTLSNSKGPAIYVRAAKTVTITLAPGSVNSLSDGGSYDIEDDDSSLDGCVFSKADLELAGSGSVQISGNYKHGIVSKDTLTVESGSWQISSVKTGVQGKDSIDVNGGSLLIAAGTNGMASDGALSVNGGSVNVSQSKEGLEAAVVNISGGETYIDASDDGINASDPDSSSGKGLGFGVMSPAGGSSSCAINISGGRLYVASGGDGIDSNGSIDISGGEIYVDGPVSNGDQAVDWQTAGNVTGGTMIATGSAGMASNVTSSEGQGTVFIGLSGEAGKEIALLDVSGSVIASFTPSKSYQCVLITSPQLRTGASYSVTVGGEEAASFTMESLRQNVNAGGMGSFGGKTPMGGGSQMPWGQDGSGAGSQRPGSKGQQNDGTSGAAPRLPEGSEQTPEGQQGEGGLTPPEQQEGSGQTPRFPGGKSQRPRINSQSDTI